MSGVENPLLALVRSELAKDPTLAAPLLLELMAHAARGVARTAPVEGDVPILITIAQAARQLGTSQGFIRARIADGQLPARRIGKRAVRVLATDVSALAKRRWARTPAPRMASGTTTSAEDLARQIRSRKTTHRAIAATNARGARP